MGLKPADSGPLTGAISDAEPGQASGRVSGPGHNGGPSLASGTAWRTHCWRVAREALLPNLPSEVLRLRVSRARDLGLDYKTYASIRAATGHDVVAFLFSTNALRITERVPALPQDRCAKLAPLACPRLALAQSMPPALILQENPDHLDQAYAAPPPFARFRDAYHAIRAALPHTPGDRVLLIGDTAFEGEWCAAGRLAAYLPADRYFATR